MKEGSPKQRTKKMNVGESPAGTLKSVAAVQTVPDLKEGDTFTFGNYYQEGSLKTPIEWLVLKRSGSQVLLISRYALDCRPYQHECVNIVTWENSDLRKWLNGEFLKSAFNSSEQERIPVTRVANDHNSRHGTFGGNSTEDRIFLLSMAEAESLFKDDEARKCVSTTYASEKDVWQSRNFFIDGRSCCFWWLRSPGYCRNDATVVCTDGAISPGGCLVNNDGDAVRPALWVNL